MLRAVVVFSVITGARMTSYMRARLTVSLIGGLALISGAPPDASRRPWSAPACRGAGCRRRWRPAAAARRRAAMLRAARAKFVSTSAPSMISTDVRPSLPKWPLSLALVLALGERGSLEHDQLAVGLLGRQRGFSASLRTFFGRSKRVAADDRAEEPCRRRGTAATPGPWRAWPVPFCVYGFLVVRRDFAASLGLVRARRRLRSCQTTQRAGCRCGRERRTPRRRDRSRRRCRRRWS